MKFGQIQLLILFLFAIIGVSNAQNKSVSLISIAKNSERLAGKAINLNTPYVTPGDSAYMVGHQNGQFPDLGWHITGEMGGIWAHPIKLMDGFSAKISNNNQENCLNLANKFINYPFGNEHIYENILGDITIKRFQFVPENTKAVVVEFTFENTGNLHQKLNFEFIGHSDLRPVWLGERTNMVDANDTAVWQNSNHSWQIKDNKNPWFVQFGANLKSINHHQNNSDCLFKSAGMGTSASLNYEIKLAPKAKISLPIVIAGSYTSANEANAIFEETHLNASKFLKQKIKKYEAIARQSKLSLPQKDLEQAFRWVKYNTDWLVRDVKEQGRGLSAGMPDYPWWFGVDTEYTLKGLVATGNKKLIYDTIDLINNISEKENGNGRIVHEVSTNGAVYNPGNVNETPQFCSMIWEVYQWTGEKAFLQKYYPTIKKGLNWLLTENDKDKNLLPDGFGMMEIHGLKSEMIDVAVYTQKAFADASKIAKILGESTQAVEYEQIANKIKTKINSDFWVAESQSFADFIGTREEALQLIDDAIIRADTLQKPWSVTDLKKLKTEVNLLPVGTKKGFVMHHNWVVNTPMEMDIADNAKAQLALKTAKKYTNPFGLFVTGIDRDEISEQNQDVTKFVRKTFTYTGAVMTLPTGVVAIGENNYGNPDTALEYLNKMTKTFGYVLPGAIYEVSPDYGMMCQAWNLYSFATPIIKQFFGIKPEAANKFIVIGPSMPSTWPNAKLENVEIGDNQISIFYDKADHKTSFELSQTKPNWQLRLQFPKNKYSRWKINGKVVVPKTDSVYDFLILSNKKNKIDLW